MRRIPEPHCSTDRHENAEHDRTASLKLSGLNSFHELSTDFILPRTPRHIICRRVTSPKLKGSMMMGMLQAMVRHVSGVKWMHEEIPQWFEKSRSLPD